MEVRKKVVTLCSIFKVELLMNRYWSFIFLLLIPFLTLKGQDSYSIINELRNTFNNYPISTRGGSYKSNNGMVNITYNEPIITIQIVHDYKNSYNNDRHINEIKVSFDVLKTTYYVSNAYSSIGNGYITIKCASGIDVYERNQWFPNLPYSKPTDKTERKLNDEFLLYSDKPVLTRIINAFDNLKVIAKEKGVKKSAPNILDNAELIVQKVSFVAPDESGKLKANQTGCFKVEVKNVETNNALEVSCIVSEKNKSELFTYEQYTTLDKIGGHETGVINVPIKASENIDNNTYQFDVKVSYKGRTLKQETINITTSNPKRQQTISTGTGGTNRNKTVRMRKMSGNTYLVSCKVNGLPLDFIFDTGASSVTLSRKQAQFMLRNGYLSRNDIVGSSSYQTASGDIATGMVIKLKKIEISGLVLNNVEATIINSDSAPLLLGQSALSRLGKIQIDYRNSTLTIIR